MALICEVRTTTLKSTVKKQEDKDWMLALRVIPLPTDTIKKTDRTDDWTRRAACKSMDIEWFVPKVGKPIDDRARSCCAQCPVAQECLDEVLTVIEDCTYRAFTTPRIRRGYRQFFNIEVADADNS